MKATKKIAGILLAILLVFAMTTTAFAAGGTGTITVDNPQTGRTYTAYKIFDLVYNADKTAYSYTIKTTSPWYATVNAYATEANKLALEATVDGTTYNVKMSEGFSAANFAAKLKTALDGGTVTDTGTALSGSNTVSANGLDLGYYFVSSNTGAICNLTSTTPDATIHDKNDVPFDKKDDQESVDVGTTVNYTITGKVPDTTGYTDYTYEIADTMSDGLTFSADDVTVKIKGVEADGADKTLVKGTDYTYTKNTNGFTLRIKVMDLQAYVTKNIEVTYSAVVNENAVAQIEKNRATLTYSNDPTDSSKTATTTPDEETVYSAKIVIDKYAAGSESTKLAGATFVLYKGADGNKQYYKWNDTAKKVEWVTDKAQATSKTTDNNGAASFDGIADGTYYLEEVKAPAGYNLLTAPVEVVVNGAKEGTVTEANLTATAKIANNTGSLLPSTGGVGTTMMFIVGGALALGAAVLFVTKKRMSKNAD